MAKIANGIALKVLKQLESPFFQKLSSAWGVGSNLTKLKRTVSAIEAVLLDAEEKQASVPNLRIWLGRLIDVLHDAENVLDEFHYGVLRKEVMKKYGSKKKKVRHLLSCSIPVASHYKMARKIKGIRKRVENIAADKDNFGLAERREDRKITLHRDVTHSFVNPSDVIGRENDKKKIIDLLMQRDVDGNSSVIPIIGIGGLGKTTLAKLVYNDGGVVSHFELRMWVCVSEDFDFTWLLKEILKSAVGSIDKNLSVYELRKHLSKHLSNEKLLLVLDDVWNVLDDGCNEKRNKWNELKELKELLFGGCNGSKIIVTTRNNSIATIMGPTLPYNLHPLSPENCLFLFKTLAFKEGEADQNLLEIGKEIVKKCEGVPLVVRTLAGLLYSEVDEHEWKFVRDNEIWNLQQKEGDILLALRLSYNQLPFHLKQCFVYCSLFPKGYEFRSIELIQFWMAHGVLQPHGNKEMEDVGDLYIKQLWSRSFFQDVDMRNFMYYTFKMHDLIHDLALSIAQGECLIMNEKSVDEKSVVGENVRHLSFSDGVEEVPAHSLGGVQTILFQKNTPMSLVKTCISRFKYLRVLDLSCSDIKVLSSSIDILKHLRYLNLCGNRAIKELPDSICKLYSLQTLLLSGCYSLQQLPKNISNMISLRFLVVPILTGTTPLFENGVGCLNSLQTLVIVGYPSKNCSFGKLDRYLTNLQTLVVDCCPLFTSLSPIIKYLSALEILIIRDCRELSLTEGEDGQDLKLRLRKLQMVNLQNMVSLPHWLQGSAKTLQQLKIEDCADFAALPEWLQSLTSLQTLEITNCRKLSSLPNGMQHITTLRELRIECCPELRRKCMEDRRNIDHVPQIHLSDVERQLSRQSFHEFKDWQNKLCSDDPSHFSPNVLLSRIFAFST